MPLQLAQLFVEIGIEDTEFRAKLARLAGSTGSVGAAYRKMGSEIADAVNPQQIYNRAMAQLEEIYKRGALSTENFRKAQILLKNELRNAQMQLDASLRGGKKFNMAMHQLSFGIQDMAISLETGGIAQGLRGMSNNISQIAFIAMPGLIGAMTGAATAIGAAMLPLFVDLEEIGDRLIDVFGTESFKFTYFQKRKAKEVEKFIDKLQEEFAWQVKIARLRGEDIPMEATEIKDMKIELSVETAEKNKLLEKVAATEGEIERVIALVMANTGKPFAEAKKQLEELHNMGTVKWLAYQALMEVIGSEEAGQYTAAVNLLSEQQDALNAQLQKVHDLKKRLTELEEVGSRKMFLEGLDKLLDKWSKSRKEFNEFEEIIGGAPSKIESFIEKANREVEDLRSHISNLNQIRMDHLMKGEDDRVADVDTKIKELQNDLAKLQGQIDTAEFNLPFAKDRENLERLDKALGSFLTKFDKQVQLDVIADDAERSAHRVMMDLQNDLDGIMTAFNRGMMTVQELREREQLARDAAATKLEDIKKEIPGTEFKFKFSGIADFNKQMQLALSPKSDKEQKKIDEAIKTNKKMDELIKNTANLRGTFKPTFTG